METIERSLTQKLIISIVVSVLFVAGIPMIPLGATSGIIPVMVAGIVFVAAGFYATPLLWVNYGHTVTLRRIVYAIKKEYLYSVGEIAAQLSMKEKEVSELVSECFKKELLTGYIRQGDNILRNEGTPIEEQVTAVACLSCGAKFSYQGKSGFCPYCGSPHTK